MIGYFDARAGVEGACAWSLLLKRESVVIPIGVSGRAHGVAVNLIRRRRVNSVGEYLLTIGSFCSDAYRRPLNVCINRAGGDRRRCCCVSVPFRAMRLLFSGSGGVACRVGTAVIVHGQR